MFKCIQIVRRFLFLSILFLANIIISGEVDPTLVWGHPLQDATKELNWYYNHEIRVTLEKLPDDCDCQIAAGEVLKHFGVTLNAPLEKWVKSSPKIDKYPAVDMDQKERYKNSIFWEKGSPVFERMQNISLDLQIDETINVGAIMISVDKLTHFTGSGYLYYKTYLKAIDKGKSKQAAMEKAIDLGILGEKYILGRFSSGVFSYADLEANFQGFLFGMDLCQEEDSLLVKRNSRWELTRPFDIRTYVNPFWDEAYNTSFYYAGQNLTLLPKSETVLKNLPRACESFHSPEVQTLFKNYDEIAKPSFSILYLHKLISAGNLPDPAPFNLRSICSEQNQD